MRLLSISSNFKGNGKGNGVVQSNTGTQQWGRERQQHFIIVEQGKTAKSRDSLFHLNKWWIFASVYAILVAMILYSVYVLGIVNYGKEHGPLASGYITTHLQSMATEPATTLTITAQPATTNSTTEQPATSDSATATADPATTRPMTAHPATADPATTKSTTAQPATSDSATKETATADPTTTKSVSTKSATTESVAATPATSEPATGIPSTTKSNTASLPTLPSPEHDQTTKLPGTVYEESAATTETAENMPKKSPENPIVFLDKKYKTLAEYTFTRACGAYAAFLNIKYKSGTWKGQGTQKKTAKRQAAYNAVKDLFPEQLHEVEYEEPEVLSNCTKAPGIRTQNNLIRITYNAK